MIDDIYIFYAITQIIEINPYQFAPYEDGHRVIEIRGLLCENKMYDTFQRFINVT